MTTTVLMGLIAALNLGGALLLLAAGALHARRFREFARLLAVHALIPGRWVRTIATAVVVAELGAGIAVPVLVSALGRSPAAPLALLAAVYAAFLGYSSVLLARRAGMACGCFGDDEPVGPWTLLRAGLLAVAAGIGAFGPTAPAGGMRLTVMAAGLVLAPLLWLLPHLMTRTPAALPRTESPR